MKSLNDLMFALGLAFDQNLIENYFVNTYYIDVDFSSRDSNTMKNIFDLRDHIYYNYENVSAIDYMPIIHRLRIYLCQNMKSE